MSNKNNTLKQVLDEEFVHVKFDNSLSKRLYDFQLRYVNLNEEHLNFFGGHSLGVQVLRFKDSDVSYFFDIVLEVDFDIIRKRIADEVPAINQDFKVSSDTYNIVCMYVIHRFLIEAKVNEKVKESACYNTALLFFYRCISALMNHYFNRGPADPATAEAAFSRLNKKFLIKRLGTWAALMDFRAKALLDKESIHLKDLKSFRDDYAIVYAINNSQGAIRSVMKPYYREFILVHEQGIRISSTSATMVDAEGKEVVKERTKGVDSQIPVFLDMMSDRDSFIKKDLIDIVRSINRNTSVSAIETVLDWMSKSSIDPQLSSIVKGFTTDVLVYSQDLIDNRMPEVNRRDFATILVKVKNYYLSTRIENNEIDKIRLVGEDIIKRSLNRKKIHRSLIMSTRTSVILYITLRNLVSS